MWQEEERTEERRKVEVSDNPWRDALLSACLALQHCFPRISPRFRPPASKIQPSHFPRPAPCFPTPTSTLSTLGAPYVESGQGYQRKEGSGNKDRGGRKGEKGRGGGEDIEERKEPCQNYALGSNLQRQARPPAFTLNHDGDLFFSTLSSIHHLSDPSAAA